MNYNNCILLDYYDGSYGPTLLINIPTDAVMNHYKQILHRLVENVPTCVEMIGMQVVFTKNVLSFRLENTSSDKVKKVLKKTSYKTNTFSWNQSPSDWLKTYNLIDTLPPGHHEYLTEEGLDDVIVELKYQEELIIPEGF